MKIAIVKLSALGDIIHAMFILQFIKKYNNKILIDWIVEESYKELLELNPNINNVHVVKFKKAKKKGRFRFQKIPLLILSDSIPFYIIVVVIIAAITIVVGVFIS